MDCQCKNSHFWMGLGVGTLIGVAATHAARSRKARELKGRFYHALHEMQHKVDALVEEAKRRTAGMRGAIPEADDE